MQFKSISLIFIFLIFGCRPTIVIPKSPPPTVVLGVKLAYAEPYHNYSITEINNNLDNSFTVINLLQSEIKELKKEPQNIEKEKEIKKLENKIDLINDKVIESWENSQYTSSEYRKKYNQLPQEYSYSSIDFTKFLDIEKGATMGSITSKFGKPEIIKQTSIAYLKNGKEILKAKSDNNNRITQIEIIGKEGLRFAQQKNVRNKSFYFLGMNSSEIEKYFPEGLTSPSKGLNGGKASEIYYTGSTKSNDAKVTFTCPRSKSFICDSILVVWD